MYVNDEPKERPQNETRVAAAVRKNTMSNTTGLHTYIFEGLSYLRCIPSARIPIEVR